MATHDDDAFDVFVGEDGTIQFVYDDALVDVFGPEATVRRASHVEPAPGGGWIADMAPVCGPMLGPFKTRAEALAAERGWLACALNLSALPMAES